MQRDKCEFDVLKKIESERLKRNWSEYTLAQNSNLTQSTISTWYSKQLQPSIASIEKICKGLGISLSQFFSENDICSDLTPEQKEIFTLLEILSPEQKKALIQLLRSFMAKPF